MGGFCVGAVVDVAGTVGVGAGSRWVWIGAAVDVDTLEAGVPVAGSLAAGLQALIASANADSDK